ncbi:hypothetical protein [Intestinimonas sp.]|uniref:hypothetical protein n=1 Tax=Intestinimonas sp. TaxID=1965293 RepID=UPI00261A0EAA|nr:hypothetical protein [Intestinimonas sp.]
MKRHISKIMLGLAMLSLIAVIYYVIYAIGEPAFFREAKQLMLAICTMMFGLFLGLYRIIDLLEQKQK